MALGCDLLPSIEPRVETTCFSLVSGYAGTAVCKPRTGFLSLEPAVAVWFASWLFAFGLTKRI